MALGVSAKFLSRSTPFIENLIKIFTKEYACLDLDANYAGNVLLEISSRAVRGLRVVALDISIMTTLLKSLPTQSPPLQIIGCRIIDSLCKEGNGCPLKYTFLSSEIIY